jgi:Mlc titration factor MtfA (ptsG expression regulator)
MFGIKRRRRRRLQAAPFPAPWHSLLHSNIALYRCLPETGKSELRGRIHVFLAEKRFEGCGGLEVTDRIRLIIAAQACLLILHRETDYFPRLRTVLVYPRAYLAPVSEPDEEGLVAEGSESRLGESLELGAVVLSWEDVLADAEQMDGANLVLHEFAHQLDAEERGTDGVPLLDSHELYASWARVLGEEYLKLRRDSMAGRFLRGRHGELLRATAPAPASTPGVVRRVATLLPTRSRRVDGRAAQRRCVAVATARAGS